MSEVVKMKSRREIQEELMDEVLNFDKTSAE